MFHYTVAIGLDDTVPTIADCRPGEQLAAGAARAIDTDYIEVSYVTDDYVVASSCDGSPYLNPLLTAIVSHLRGEHHPVYGAGALLASDDDFDIVPLTPVQAQMLFNLKDDLLVQDMAVTLRASRSLYDLV